MGDSRQGGKRERSSPVSPNSCTKRPNTSTMEEKIDKLVMSVDKLASVMSTISGEMKEMKQQIADMKEVFDQKEAKWAEEKRELENTNRILEDRLDSLERNEKRNSAILTGLSVTRDNARAVVNGIFGKLPSPVLVNEISCFTTNKGTKALVRFASHDDKMKVMRAKKALNFTDDTGKISPVFIDDDLTKKDQFINYLARKAAKDYRQKGKEVKIGFRKLIVDGAIMPFDDALKKFVDRKN